VIVTRKEPLLGIAIAAAGAVAGCLPASTSPMDGGTTMDAATVVTYANQIQPILLAKCSPCHSTEHQGFHNIATNYADAIKPVESIDSVGCWNDPEMTMPKKVGECALISAQNGRMPFAMGCDQNPSQAVCVNASEQQLMAQWVDAGLPE
jgi:hypothetical protein